jgi:hypothetical protein
VDALVPESALNKNLAKTCFEQITSGKIRKNAA